MAGATTKKLLQLLEPDQPVPVRRSALVVLGEIGDKDKQLADALSGILKETDAGLRIEAMRAIGKLRLDSALGALLERVKAGGEEADVAAQTAAGLGARGVKALRDLMGHTAPGLRRRIAGALAAGGTASAETAAVETLLDSDPGVVDAATRSLIAEFPSLSDSQRRAVADQVLALLQPKKAKKLSAHSEAALVRLLLALGDPRGEPIFWARTEPGFSPEVRAEALGALGRLSPPSGSASLKRLLACATDTDFRVVAPALMILKGVAVSGKNQKELLPLLQAPDMATRRFAIDKLAGQDKPEVAEALLAQLKHPDKVLREQALAALAQLKHGHAALADRLLDADSADEAWVLARAQAGFAAEYSPPLRTKLFNRACTYLDSEDRRADALLFVLRQADAKSLRDRLAERALAVRKKKLYENALHFLRLLAQDPACGEGLRFELAACGLKISARDLTPSARAADPCLGQFSRLVHNHDTPPLTYLEKATWLGPEDLFYLGFHFAEGTGAERDFGGQVLRLVLKRAGKARIAKDARAKLRSLGLT